jgi:hypothetical protein
MNKLSLPELKKQLKSYKTNDLISIIVDCYKLSDDVKKYVHIMLEPESTAQQLFEEAKSRIVQEFYPNRGEPKLRLAQAKKAITEFNKLCNDHVKTLELMIYYVELGVEFTNDYGDINEQFYYSMESMYQNVLKKIRAERGRGLYNLYRDRLIAIVNNTEDIGWGFHDQLAGMYLEMEHEYEDGE